MPAAIYFVAILIPGPRGGITAIASARRQVRHVCFPTSCSSAFNAANGDEEEIAQREENDADLFRLLETSRRVKRATNVQLTNKTRIPLHSDREYENIIIALLALTFSQERNRDRDIVLKIPATFPKREIFAFVIVCRDLMKGSQLMHFSWILIAMNYSIFVFGR